MVTDNNMAGCRSIGCQGDRFVQLYIACDFICIIEKSVPSDLLLYVSYFTMITLQNESNGID